MPAKPTTIYRNLLREAWALTWHRKSLWVFGLFAACISTGGVVEIVWRAVARVQTGAVSLSQMLNHSFPGYELFGRYLREWTVLPTDQVTILVTLYILIGVAVLVAALVSQAALVKGVHALRPFTLNEAIAASRGHFPHVLSLALLSKIAYAILFALAVLPLALLQISNPPLEALIAFLIFVVFVVAAVAVGVISMIALIEIVRENRHAIDGIHAGWKLFREHWIACMEYGLLLFVVVLVGGLAVFAGLTLVSIPFAILLLLSILSGSPFLFALMNTVGTILFFTIIFSYVGASVVYQYAAWMLFFDRSLLRGPGRLQAKVRRLWAKR